MKLKLYYVAYQYEGTDLIELISGPHPTYMSALQERDNFDDNDKNLLIVCNTSEVEKI